MRSVGTPEFEFDEISEAPDTEFFETGTETPRTPLLLIGLAIGALLVGLFAAAGLRDEPTDATADFDANRTATTFVPEHQEDVAEEVLADRRTAESSYMTRPVTDESILVATEGPNVFGLRDGFFGLRAGVDGQWLTARSVDGVHWTPFRDQPLSGVSDEFANGLGAARPIDLQYVDGSYWARFAGPITGDGPNELVLLTSPNGIDWRRTERFPATIDQPTFAGTDFGDPTKFVVRDSQVFDTFRQDSPSLFRVPNLPGERWRVVESTANSHGAALILFNNETLEFRVALSADGTNWETTTLDEGGVGAIEIVVIGTESAVLVIRFFEKPDVAELLVPLPLSGPPRLFDLRVVDLAVDHMAPVDNGFGAFIAGESRREIAFIRSDDGLEWRREQAVTVVGIPENSRPQGLWQLDDGSLLGAFTDRFGTTLYFASSPNGFDWTVGPEFVSDGGQLRPELVESTSDGAFISYAEVGVAESAKFYLWTPGRDEIVPVEIEDGQFVKAVLWSDMGLLVSLTPSALDLGVGEADFELRLLADGGWTIVDNDTRFPIEALEQADSGEIIALTKIGSFRTTQNDVLFGTEIVWMLGGPITDNSSFAGTGNLVVQEIRTGTGGAAAVVVTPDEPSGFTVVVTKDFNVWSPVRVTSRGSVRIDAVGDEEVILSGFLNAPYRARVLLE